MKRLDIVACLLAFVTLPFSAQAQAFVQLGAAAFNALLEVNQNTENLTKMRGAAADALAGQSPHIPNDFDELSRRYRKAAADLSSSPLATDYVAYQPVTLDEIRNCSTRENARQRLHQQLDSMYQARGHGSDALKELDDADGTLATAHAGLDYLRTNYDKLVQVPIWGDAFANGWYGLNVDVSNALASVHDAVHDQRRKLTENLALLDKETSNFQSNLSMLDSLAPCNPFQGSWDGYAATNRNPIPFGGGAYCQYVTVIKDIHLHVDIDKDGNVTGLRGNGVMDEELRVPCGPIRPGGVQPYIFRLQFGEAKNGVVNATFKPVRPGSPECNASFSGGLKNGRLNGTLRWERINAGALNWNTPILIE